MSESTNHAKARQWQQHFDSFDRSGLSIRKFCSQHRLAVHSFQYWSRRLNRNTKPSKRANGSIPVANDSSLLEVTIELGNQVSIRIPATELTLAKSILQMALSLRAESSSFQPVAVRD